MRPTIALRAIVFALVLFAIPCGKAGAQFAAAPPLLPDVLNPTPKYWYIAPLIGVNSNTHGGDFLPAYCNECKFGDGKGTALMVGLQLEHLPTPDYGIAVKLLFDDKSAQYTQAMPSVQRLVTDLSTVTVAVERTMDAKLAYFVINPVFEVFPLKHLYLFAGPGIGFPVTNEYTVKERMLDPNFAYVESGSNEVLLGQSEWTEIPGVKSPRIDIRAGIGYNLKLSRSVILAPELSYEYPITTISDDDNWKASAMHGVVVLKFAL